MKLRAIPEPEMAATWPRAWDYLKRFELLLRARPAFRRYFKSGAPFYSQFNIGDYTFAPWKVVWREQALPFRAVVIGASEGKVVVPDHKLMLVAAGSPEEAHYLCGVLNSIPVGVAVAAYAVEIQIDTHVLAHIAVPRFNPQNDVHVRLAVGSQKAHAAVRAGARESLAEAEAEIDHAAASLWGLGQAELREMRLFLKEALHLDTPKPANIS